MTICGLPYGYHVGIGMGLHTAQRLFKFNPNRIDRIVDTVSRPDYKITTNSGSILVETKGGKDNGAAGQMIKEIKEKKDKSIDEWVKKEGAKIYVGIVTPVISKDSIVTKAPILICDPPSSNIPKSKIDEIRSVYRYYENFIILCLLKNAFVDSFLGMVLQLEDEPNLNPNSFSIGHSPKGRVEETAIWNKKWYGTYFDKRLFPKSISSFETFEAASHKIEFPIYFLGIDKKLINLFKKGFVDEILKYSLNETYYETDEKVVQISSSGIVHIFLKGSNNEFEKASRNSFELQRKNYLRAKNAI